MATETLCTFKSGGDEGEPLWNCEECNKPIPKGGDIHFIPDGGMSPDGTYVGACCLGLWTNPQTVEIEPMGDEAREKARAAVDRIAEKAPTIAWYKEGVSTEEMLDHLAGGKRK